MTTKAKKIANMIDHIANESAAAGIRFELRNTETVIDRHTVGFFSEESKELIVAAKDDDWWLTAAHEFSHLQQWKEGLFDCGDEYDAYDDWIKGKVALHPSAVIDYTRKVQECELDCEKRTVKLLQKFRLLPPARKIEYIKRAVGYVYLYEIARRQGRWSKAGNSPLDNKKIWSLLPAKFDIDVGRPPDDFEAAVLDFCF